MAGWIMAMAIMVVIDAIIIITALEEWAQWIEVDIKETGKVANGYKRMVNAIKSQSKCTVKAFCCNFIYRYEINWKNYMVLVLISLCVNEVKKISIYLKPVKCDWDEIIPSMSFIQSKWRF